MSKTHVVMFSGGKDSLAQLIVMMQRKEPIHSVVNVDVGWEFPWMYDHINKVAAMLESKGIKFVRFNIADKIRYLMFKHAVFGRDEPYKGKLRYFGKGWPGPGRRWCTREKNELKDKYIKSIDGAVSCIGFAADEAHRAESKNLKKQPYDVRFPLIEEGLTEVDALALCREHGYYPKGGSPYDHFRRVSCFCCPLQPIEELRALRVNYPNEWAIMLKWDKLMPSINKPFKAGETVHDLDARFEYEASMMGHCHVA